MTVSPSIRSFRRFIACRAARLALPALCLLCVGCFLPRDYSAWSNPKKTAEQYGILPVLPAQVRITLEDKKNNSPYDISLGNSNVKNQEEVARTINRVLDTIAHGEHNKLRGPTKIDSALKRCPDWKNLQVYLQDPGPIHETWKREGFAKISRELGHSRFLRVNSMLRFKPNMQIGAHGSRPLGHHWDGRITVEVVILDLLTAQVITSGAGEAHFYGRVGAVGIGGYGAAIIIPYAFGKAFDRAVDQAIRKALAKLFGAPPKEGSVQ